MKEYIERNALIDEIQNGLKTEDKGTLTYYVFQAMINELRNIPAADVVSKGLYEQIKFERDIAMEQLQENGIAFGAEVQRNRWLFVCEHANRLDYECENCRGHIQTINEPDYILTYKRCPICGAIMW